LTPQRLEIHLDPERLMIGTDGVSIDTTGSDSPRERRRHETEIDSLAGADGRSGIFAMARRYARRESEVEDIVQEVFIKAFQKLDSYRAEAPFEHWLMRLSVRTCYDFLRNHQRNRESVFTDMTDQESDWLERFAADPDTAVETADAARDLVERVLSQLPPSARLILTLLEIEERSVKEISELTGWSISLVKIRAFRARAAMRKCLAKMMVEKYM
jgi:RNA polymerase sigma-70 factor (ECF subfamily)